MKEYLVKTDSGSYLYTKNVSDIAAERVIEVPEGADVAFKKKYGDGLCFFQCVGDNGADWCSGTRKWISRIHPVDDWYFKNSPWQRHTQPEELPFVDDEPKYTDDEVKYMDENGQGRSQSINDQYAEIEQVRKQSIEATLAERQAQYGCFEDVAFVTENIMAVLSKVRTNGLNDLPHTHRMALYMIASKMARIVNGDFNYRDNWHDIGGYSKLIEDLL